MHDANFNDWDEFQPQARPASRRLSFCPTCGRPFVRGTGVLSPACSANRGVSPKDNPECKEYCREQCMPGILA